VPVTRAPALVRANPLSPPEDGRRGTNASNTAAVSASRAPTHNTLGSTVRSRARME
jgi:hypothetical protein